MEFARVKELGSNYFLLFCEKERSPVYRDCYEIEDGTGAARDVHCDVKVTDKARQAPRSVYLENERTNCEDQSSPRTVPVELAFIALWSAIVSM